MHYEEFLGARLVFLVGAPSSGQNLIVEQLESVGLIGRDEVIFVGHGIGTPEGDRVQNWLPIVDLEAVCGSRASQFRRTIVVLALTTLDEYTHFADVVQGFDEVACIVVMDMHADAVVDRLRPVIGDPIRLVQLENLLDELSSGEPRSLGIPSVYASTLSRAIEGQDDW